MTWKQKTGEFEEKTGEFEEKRETGEFEEKTGNKGIIRGETIHKERGKGNQQGKWETREKY